MRKNIIRATDSYKVSHHKALPPQTQRIYCYLESRANPEDYTVFFGMQGLIQEWLEGRVVTRDNINEAEVLFNDHFGRTDVFNRAGWTHIINEHGGYLPLLIKAVPEGSRVWNQNILFSVENTDDKCAWLPGYLEPLFDQLWYTINIATYSDKIRHLLEEYAYLTSDHPENVPFQYVDFGVRGCTCMEQAERGGAAHLLHFKATDNIPALGYLQSYYDEKCAGFSIPATEHGVIAPWGRERECDAYANFLTQYPNGTIACVMDTYNVYKAIKEHCGTTLRDKILLRDGILVVRPDSGPPVEMVRDCLQLLGEQFGYYYNSKGYKVLNDKVRLIQGDGIDFEMTEQILRSNMNLGWAFDNVSFGSGGGLLQKTNRDTNKIAYKPSALWNGSEWIGFKKDPITDPGKCSKEGRLQLIGLRNTVPENTMLSVPDCLKPVFFNGSNMGLERFQILRNRLWS